MHAAAFGYVSRTLLGPPPLPPRRAVVELGSADINGGVRQLFMGGRYVGVDLAPGHGVDVVADAATYEPPFTPDTVVCCEVLEHTERAADLVANAYRMLAPGGLFIVTCAGEGRQPHSAADGGPLPAGEFYRNVPAADLEDWLQRFGDYGICTQNPGDVWAHAWKGK